MTEPNDASPYQLMEAKDEDQILAEMKGEFLSQFVYSFRQGNRDITNLSYVGIKEAIRRRGHYQIIEQIISEANGKIRALIKVHDLVNDIDVLGASEAESDKPFAYVLAINKAERNAFAKVIPAKLIAEMIAEKLGKKTETPKEVERSQKMPKDVTPEQLKQEGEQVPVSYQLNSWIKPDLYANLTIDEQGSDIILKPKERFEAPDFKAICAAVEHFKGKWVSVDGVWVIPNA
jgi:hypothetical protein